MFGGGEGYKRRVFVLYSGDHYDALVFTPSTAGAEMKVFSTRDEASVQRVQGYVESLHQQLVASGQATKQSGFKRGAAGAGLKQRTGGHTTSGATKWSCEGIPPLV